ncbi:pre-rRNA-processing protein TSR2 homolog [Plectropomus leopardus]|uniref:pre-rRNA-processing protein TSR2 homolog n=1 Tax=Plectropomus leopardus TaxID=160734 RepID=UPI001C4B5486|nr:pre-rRNA-processing protein TSR2 homolog [Plectropomus leopardus]
MDCAYLCSQVCDGLMQVFGLWQQGELQQLRQTIITLTSKKGQRAKVMAPPTPSGEDSDDDTQVMECEPSVPSVSRMDPPPAAPAAPGEEEEDGWTVVRKKK